MIVKFLYTDGPNGHFPAVNYNTGKMDRNKGELMKLANFGALQALSRVKPQDLKNYLRAVSALNKSVKKPQLHVTICCGGHEYNKEQLTEIAELWLEKMGYGKQPYLIIFHKDTDNNHLHLVSTRVGLNGKKINDSFEQVRGYEVMNAILGIDPKHNARTDMENALSYNFKTKAQFLMILESMGYSHKEEDGNLLIFKFGKQQGQIATSDIDMRIGAGEADEHRKKQITAWFHKYALQHDTTLKNDHGKYRSEFSAWLKIKLGVELVFHASADKPPYGYSVIDHTQKNVFKGGDIMPLKELLTIRADDVDQPEIVKEDQVESPVSETQLTYYASILKAVVHNYPDMVQGLQHQGLTLTRNGDDYYLHDPGSGFTMNADELLNEHDYQLMGEQFSQSAGVENNRQQIYVPGISISDDIDDEAINGRNRRRKKKARTNHR